MRKTLLLGLLSILSAVSLNLRAQTNNDGVWYSFYNEQFDIYTIGEKSFDVFAPTQDSLRFSYEYAGGVTAISPFQSQETDVYESADGSNMTHIGDADGIKRYDVYTNMPVSRDINKLLFKRDVGNTYGVNYKRVNVRMAKHILLAEGEYGTESITYDFKQTQVGEVLSATVDLRSFLTMGDITISSDNPAFRVGSADNTEGLVWAVGANACASPNGADGALAGGETLGDIDQYSVAIYFCPDYVKDYQGVITLTDGVSTATISVTGVGYVEEQWAQEIIWDLDILQMTVGDTLRLNAVATSGLEVGYSLNNADVCALENNMLIALAAGEIIVTATQEGNALYLPAEEVTCTITVVPAEDDEEDGDDVTSDLEDMFAEQVKVRKIIRDGKMYIIRDNQVYDMLGTRL